LTSMPDDKRERWYALREPPYRSRGEAQVGRILNRYGISFYHEQPTLIYDRGKHRIWHPDFTLPNHNRLIIEYAGMMDLPEYAAGVRHKQRAYASNGIEAMFVYPRDLSGPRWPERLRDNIARAARPRFGYSARRDFWPDRRSYRH